MEPREYQLMNQLEKKHWWFVSKRNYIQTYLKLVSFPSKPSILDVGCGTGINLELLSNYGQASGVDTSKLALRHCRQKNLKSVRQASAEKLPFKPQSFNLVTLFDVLYHQGIKSDLQVLKQVYRVLKPGGFVLITDCAHQWLYGPHDQSMHARQRYSRSELVKKLTQAGFQVKKSSYIYFLTFPIFLFKRLVRRLVKHQISSDVLPVPRLTNQLLILLLRLEAKLLHFINLPFGSSIIILAQK